MDQLLAGVLAEARRIGLPRRLPRHRLAVGGAQVVRQRAAGLHRRIRGALLVPPHQHLRLRGRHGLPTDHGAAHADPRQELRVAQRRAGALLRGRRQGGVRQHQDASHGARHGAKRPPCEAHPRAAAGEPGVKDARELPGRPHAGHGLLQRLRADRLHRRAGKVELDPRRLPRHPGQRVVRAGDGHSRERPLVHARRVGRQRLPARVDIEPAGEDGGRAVARAEHQGALLEEGLPRLHVPRAERLGEHP
eukprot:886514-Lingulodinium_polyedra.AAC.1